MNMNENTNSENKIQANERPVWTNSVRYIALVCLLLAIIVFAYLLRGSLTLIILAGLVAYLINPVVRFFHQKLHFHRNLAIAVAYILLLILVSLAVSFFIPWVTQAVRNFFAIDWPQVLAAIESSIEQLMEEIDTASLSVGGLSLDLSKPLENIHDNIRSLREESINIDMLFPDLTTTAKQIFSISTNVFGQIMTGLIVTVTTVMASLYFCRDGYKIWDVVVDLFEEKYQPEVNELLKRLRIVWSRYFIGELKLMLYICIITFVVYTALGLRWALLLGIIAGFCEVVPNIGPVLATIPAIISALIFGSSWLPFNNIVIAVLAVIASIVIQQTENIFLVPHIMGNALELHPVIIIIGIMALSSRLGILGAVFAAPMIALTKEVLYFIIKKIKKQDPYPEIYSQNLKEEV